MKIIAHRGAEAYAPENTFASFDLAIRLRSDGIETDVQKTSDGQLVLFHDLTLERTTNGSGVLQEKTWQEIKDLDAGSWFNKKFSNERIPLLKDYLERFGYKTHTDIEIKQEGIEDDVLDLVRKNDLLGEVTFTSFYFETIANIKKKEKNARVGWLINDFTEVTIQKTLDAKMDQISPPAVSLSKELVAVCHSYGLFIRVWGATNDKLIRHAIDMGADGMTVATPDFLNRLLN